MKRMHVLISGTVTGVFFRKFVSDNAKSLDIKGWVKNDENKVEAVLEGKDMKVDELVKLCRRGPPGASITKFDAKKETYKAEFSNFEVKY